MLLQYIYLHFITNVCWIGKYEFLKIALKEIFLLITVGENLFMNAFRVKTDWQIRSSQQTYQQKSEGRCVYLLVHIYRAEVTASIVHRSFSFNGFGFGVLFMGRKSSLLPKSRRNGMSATPNAELQELRSLFFRISIGGICVVFLIVLIFGRMIFEGPGFLDSISDYYYSPSMGNVFVGGLCVLATLLMCYHYQSVDTIASIFAGICAIGVAIFPKSPEIPHPTELQTRIGMAHWAFAGLFLLTIALMVLFLFTKSNQDTPVGKKRQRNTVYLWCGYAMLASIALCFIVQNFFLSSIPWLQAHHPVFWFELIALVLFIFAWIVKGQVLWKDENQGLTSLSDVLASFRANVSEAITSLRSIFSAKVSAGEHERKHS